MSTLKVSSIQHPNAATAGITLSGDGTVFIETAPPPQYLGAMRIIAAQFYV